MLFGEENVPKMSETEEAAEENDEDRDCPTRALVCHVLRVRIGCISERFFGLFFGPNVSAPSISDHFPTCKFAFFVTDILRICPFFGNFLSKLLPIRDQL